MRDHSKLKAFQLAHSLVADIYRETKSFPTEERFGLTNQVRRAAVSVPSNIVEGCARNSLGDYVHFLDIAYGSAREMEYQVMLAKELGFLTDESYAELEPKTAEVCKVLNSLIRSLRAKK